MNGRSTASAAPVGSDLISPRTLLNELLGPRLGARLTLWPDDEPQAAKPRRIGPAFREAINRSRLRTAFRRWAVVALLAALGFYTAISLTLNQAVASLGPAGVLGVVALYLSLHRSVRR